MQENVTWRELLARVISDPRARERIADALNINAVTLTRWVSGQSNPRPEKLVRLLNALPQYREQLKKLIALEYPFLFTDALEEDEALTIPTTFYARVIQAYATSLPSQRSSSIYALVLQQMLGQLDAPSLGMAIILVQCLAPTSGGKVRSLRTIVGRGTPPWQSSLENQTQFYGIESQVGGTVQTGRSVTISSHEERERVFPSQAIFIGESVFSYPILRADRIAGCIYITSTQRNHFTPARIELIKSYVDLLVLAFEPGEFYDISAIDLGIMPDWEWQLPFLQDYPRRVTQIMIQSNQQGAPLSRPQAELLAWKELEEEFLLLGLEE